MVQSLMVMEHGAIIALRKASFVRWEKEKIKMNLPLLDLSASLEVKRTARKTMSISRILAMFLPHWIFSPWDFQQCLIGFSAVAHWIFSSSSRQANCSREEVDIRGPVSTGTGDEDLSQAM